MRTKVNLIVGALSTLIMGATPLTAQCQEQVGFVRANGRQILDNRGENLITRSIGTGNWMIQEGYMMQSSQFAGPQWQFRERLERSIGKRLTDEFYDVWLDKGIRKSDIDSMKVWGFNSVRPALHYKWFTLPIEEEPIEGENTWLEAGFEKLDEFVDWCAESEMYVFLDMHGCPGGQGYDANISDYNPDKPSLWESEANKEKLIALWVKIAERYADNPWIGGYDFINEPNWPELTERGGVELRDIFERLISAVRKVDKNHMFIVEGNYWGNDYTGMLEPWGDDNICYSFHRYWCYNNPESLDYMLNISKECNVPLWIGESGENSNVWFTDAIQLAEENNIGWSWWPVKKDKINNVLRVVTPEEYKKLMLFFGEGEPKMTPNEVYNAVMSYAEAQLTENCIVQYDVLDAMLRQPFTTETKPYKTRTDKDILYAVDYDLGRSGYAYQDTKDANYYVSTGEQKIARVSWNMDMQYRNDGVDIAACTTANGNGYVVGWIDSGEWMQHTIEVGRTGTYTATITYSSESPTNTRPGEIYFEVDGKVVSDICKLTPTKDKDDWQTATLSGIKLKKGTNKLKWIFKVGDFRLSSVELELER